jgi:PKD domain
MSANPRRLVGLVAVLVTGLVIGVGSGGAGTTALRATAKKPSKVTEVIVQAAAEASKLKKDGKSAKAASNGAVSVSSDGAVDVTVWAREQVSNRELADLRRLGAKIETSASGPAQRGKPQYGVIAASVPYDRLEDVAALTWVAALTPTMPTQVDVGPNLSEGVALHRADDVQARGIDGTGVTVGVISDGVSNLAASQGLGDLPAGVNVINAGSGDEGTAMLEIVQDMAPGAGLAFHGTGGGVAGHVTALVNLVLAGVDVITEDIPFDAEPAFQQGLAASAGETVASVFGIPVHSSAGNQAQRHAPRVVANGTGGGPDGTAGPYAGCGLTPDNVIAIGGGADTTFDVTLTNNATFVLQWSEPRAIFPTAGQGGFTDLNLYVMNNALTQCLGQSTAGQANGVGDTIEIVSVGGMAGTNAKLVVDVEGTSSAVAAPTVDLRWRGAGAVDTPVRAGSLNPDSNYTGLATSSAAVDAQNVNSAGVGALEGFSSGGPVQLRITTQCPGGAAGPCAGVAGSTQTALAPTWSAADNVDVSGVGGFGSPFTGTSAAAPHAAACDALLRDETNAPNANPATTNARLAATAIDFDSPGTDNNTGAGQLDCLLAINDPPVADAGGPYATQEGTNVVVTAAGSTDPDVGDSLTFAWDFDNDGSFDDATGVSPAFDLVGQDGVFTIRVRATDTAGVSDTDTAQVTVTNVAPTVGPITTNAPQPENSGVRIQGVISDPGWLDPLTASIDFGTGAGPQPLAGVLENVRPNATLTYDVTHVYGDNGTFTVTVCAADDDTTGNCNQTNVEVTNVDPTATIDESGTVLVNGVPTFIVEAGSSLAIPGRSTDPGSDDLTLTWLWGDGSPNTSLTSLVNPPTPDPFPSPSIQPRDVTLSASHSFVACLYDVGFRSADDDGGASPTDTVKVLVTGTATERFSGGYWQNVFRDRKSSPFSDAQLLCYLEIAGFVSDVFHELVNVATIELAYDVLKVGGGTSAREQFDRQLLAALVNFANGDPDFDELIDTDQNGVGDTPFLQVIANVEAVRLNPASTDAQIIAAKNLLERINLEQA